MIETAPAFKLGAMKRRSIKSSNEVVKIAPLHGEGIPPLLVECQLPSLELSPWAADNLPLIQSLLQKHGAVLFRGFAPEGPEGMQKFNSAIGMKLMNYMEGATPRKRVTDNVYTSTEFPEDQTIAQHNENSYVMTFPMKVCFSCVIAPEDRGETPIADVRDVLRRIPADIRKRFEEKQYMLVRNFSEHLSLDWRTSFKVSTREEMERYALNARLELEWQDDDRLKTRQVRPAIATHPVTGDQIWFNHIAFWHVSSLEKNVREVLLAGYSEEGLPYNTYYGDRTRIEDDVIEVIRQAYEAAITKFAWMKGDLLLLDNMLVSHGRSPFSGPRKILVSLGDPHTRSDV